MRKLGLAAIVVVAGTMTGASASSIVYDKWTYEVISNKLSGAFKGSTARVWVASNGGPTPAWVGCHVEDDPSFSFTFGLPKGKIRTNPVEVEYRVGPKGKEVYKTHMVSLRDRSYISVFGKEAQDLVNRIRRYSPSYHKVHFLSSQGYDDIVSFPLAEASSVLEKVVNDCTTHSKPKPSLK